MDNSIEKKLNELIEALEEQEEIKRYRQIERRMSQSEELMEKIKQYKRWQQKVVLNEQHTGETPNEAQEKLDRLYDELLEVPIYNEYTNLMGEINDVLQGIIKIVEEVVND